MANKTSKTVTVEWKVDIAAIIRALALFAFLII